VNDGVDSWVNSLTSGISYRVTARTRQISRILDAREEKKYWQAAGLSNVDRIVTDTVKAELKALYELASSCPHHSNVLEIGSYLGASACYLSAGLSKNRGHLYCVDTWNNETMLEGMRDTYAEFLDNTKNFSHMITSIRKRSCELSSDDLSLPLHLVFIDADHSYEAVKADFTLVSDWLADDGVIALHDFATEFFPGVTRVLGEALASGEWIMSGWVQNLAWIKKANWSHPPGLIG
jgi:predicted O-methyltransferase YrrM